MLVTVAIFSRAPFTSARSQSTLIVLVPPVMAGQNDQEVMNRVRGELAADGFNVQVVDPVPASDRAALLSRAARDAGNDPLAIGLLVDADANAIELWLVDPISGALLVRKFDIPPPSPDQKPEVVARRTVDVLRANLLDLLVSGLRTAVSEVHGTPRVESSAVRRDTGPRARLEGGLAVLASFGGVGPAALPVLRGSLLIGQAFELRATGAWLGTRPTVQAATGSAVIDQGLALLEWVVRFEAARWRVRPLLSVGAGAYYAGIEGNAAPPYVGLRKSQVAFAADAGLGAAVPVARSLELVVEAHTLLAEPAIGIRFLRVDTADIGRPSVLGTLTLAGRF
ncbi:MAG: hypothetical protein M3O36_10715 [Myxococcota bacterium]|nr:hypothetical protein [Myxococcota bacterium]